MTEPSHREATGHRFSMAAMLLARERSNDAVQRIGRAIRPGMLEGEAAELATGMLRDMGMQRLWHRTIVRFGESTLKKFSQRSDDRRALRERDIFFVDIGPVWDRHEGDAGDTFVVGGDPEMMASADAVRALWRDVAHRWQTEGLGGQALYGFAAERASAMGWRLNLDIKGHRVSDFPHAVYKAGNLADFANRPSTGLWILEIQIAHPEQPYGAFFEDMLVSTERQYRGQ